MAIPTVFALHRERFVAELQRFGFSSTDSVNWRGIVGVEWYEPESGTRHRADEPISIHLPPGFPCAKPRMTPSSVDSVIRDSLHREPDGPACLWRDDDSGWLPSMTLQDLLARTREWFVRCREQSWRDDERPADLHLYYTGGGNRTMMVIGTDWHPAKDALTGRFGVWQRNNLIAFAGDPRVGASFPAHASKDRVLTPLGLADEKWAHPGIWFRLDSEPQRGADLRALLKMIDNKTGQGSGWALAQFTGAIGKKADRSTRMFVALGYPSTKRGEHWLFLGFTIDAQRGRKWSRPDLLASVAIEACITAPADPMAMMRRIGPMSEVVAKRHVVIFGVGAIGSEIAIALAKSGVGSLSLIDSDVMSPTNAVRHVAGISAAGLPKAMALRLEILDHAPDCNVQVGDTTWDPEKIGVLVAPADLIVDSTAHTAFSLLLNQVAIESSKPLMVVTAHRRGKIGRIRLIRNREDACLTCYEAAAGHRENPKYPLIPAGDEGAFVEEGCGTPTVEAAAIDLAVTALTASRLAMDFLSMQTAHENHYLVVAEPIDGASGSLATAGRHASRWEPLPTCESCRPQTS